MPPNIVESRPTAQQVRPLPKRPIKLPLGLTVARKNGHLSPSELEPIDGGQLHVSAAGAWKAMHDHAQRDGFRLVPVTGAANTYRTYDQQCLIFRKRFTTEPVPSAVPCHWDGLDWYLLPGKAPAAVPGTSTHGWGLAVDVFGLRRGTALMDWMLVHANTYGWCWELENEPWHVVFHGGAPGNPTP